MNRFNEYLAHHFKHGGCRLIARAHDRCRDRRVELYAVPGHWDVVGVSDGTDAWIAPCSAGLFFATASGDCADLMRRLQAGEELPPIPDAPPRARTRARLPETDHPPAATAAPQPSPERRTRARL